MNMTKFLNLVVKVNINDNDDESKANDNDDESKANNREANDNDDSKRVKNITSSFYNPVLPNPPVFDLKKQYKQHKYSNRTQ